MGPQVHWSQKIFEFPENVSQERTELQQPRQNEKFKGIQVQP